MTKVLRRVRLWVRRRRAAAELAEEIETHRLMRQEELERSGVSTEEAAILSKRALGNALLAREESHDVWRWSLLEDAWRDLLAGVRDFRKAPGFWLVASAILSLGIGVNVAAFQLLDAVFFKVPEIREPQSLVRLFRGRNGSFPFPAVSILATNQVFSALIVRSNSEFYVPPEADIHRNLVWGNDPDNKPWVSFVSANWFDELGYRPIRGRVFQEGVDDAPDSAPAIVLSESFWKRHLDSDPDIIGKTVRVNNRTATVVGVVPPDVMPHNDTMVWLPLAKVDYFVSGNELKTAWRSPGVQVYGRLRPGVPVPAIREALQPVMDELARQHPEAFNSRDVIDPARATARFTSPARAGERWIIAATGLSVTSLILMIACANLINLVLSRGISRVRDWSLRVALGAGRGRVLRQLVAESVLLVATSCACSLVLVYWASRIFPVAAATQFPGLPDVAMNWRTVLASLITGALAIVAVGLFPAWRVSRADLITAIKDGGQQVSSGLNRTRWKSILLGVQIGCSGVLLVLTGTILHRLQGPETAGFDPESVVIFRAPLERQGIRGGEALSYWQRLRDAVSSDPQTVAVSLVSRPPFGQGSSDDGNYEIGPGFFDAARIPILAGRDFDDSDQVGNSVIISEALALKMYGSHSVVGQPFPKIDPHGTVVGIVGDVATSADPRADKSRTYLPLNPEESTRILLVRVRGSAAAGASMLRSLAENLNRDVLPDAHPLTRDVENQGGETRALSLVFSILGSLAVGITCIGIFGTISFSAMLRRQEIGIRIALGAPAAHVLLLLLHQLKWPLLIGLTIGLAMAVPFGRSVGGVPLNALDFRAMTGAVALIVGSVAIAGLVPAWRVLRSNPLESLRSE
jgi:predicted permease